MRYYRKLDIDFKQLQYDLRSYIASKDELIAPGKGSWRLAPQDLVSQVPGLVSMIKSLELNVAYIGFFVVHVNESSIHIDNTHRMARINIPVLNCKNTWTRYFSTHGDSHKNQQKNGVGYFDFRRDQVDREVDRFQLDAITIMRVLEPHQVIVDGDQFPRVSCTVAVEENLEPLLNG